MRSGREGVCWAEKAKLNSQPARPSGRNGSFATEPANFVCLLLSASPLKATVARAARRALCLAGHSFNQRDRDSFRRSPDHKQYSADLRQERQQDKPKHREVVADRLERAMACPRHDPRAAASVCGSAVCPTACIAVSSACRLSTTVRLPLAAELARTALAISRPHRQVAGKRSDTSCACRSPPKAPRCSPNGCARKFAPKNESPVISDRASSASVSVHQ